MKLILVPLMNSNQNRQTLIRQSIELAQNIQNDFEQIAVIVGILTATDKIIDEEYSKSIREWLRMLKVEKIYQQEKEQALKELAYKKEEEKKELLKELLFEAYKNGDSPKTIQRLIEKGNFNQDEIEEIYRQVEKH
ncbi:hypothetical protein [Bacillus sp. UNC438CL73TsuS30]|uniref:hypothetical protein n=1 Tax=Bacillus sp. UNC438CL73TsuS30 TaxID=1340434 RepID=UPI00068CCBB8|nr:hypothetical protein [Bacillus sp. UNC438CL73TsuS30]